MKTIEHEVTFTGVSRTRARKYKRGFSQEVGIVTKLRQQDIELDRVYVTVEVTFDKAGKFTGVSVQESRMML